MTGPTDNTKRALYNILTYVRLLESDRKKIYDGSFVTRLAFGPFDLLKVENLDFFLTSYRHDSCRRLPKRDGRNAIKLCYFYRVSFFALPSAGCVPRLSQQYQDLARRYRPIPHMYAAARHSPKAQEPADHATNRTETNTCLQVYICLGHSSASHVR